MILPRNVAIGAVILIIDLIIENRNVNTLMPVLRTENTVNATLCITSPLSVRALKASVIDLITLPINDVKFRTNDINVPAGKASFHARNNGSVVDFTNWNKLLNTSLISRISSFVGCKIKLKEYNSRLNANNFAAENFPNISVKASPIGFITCIRSLKIRLRSSNNAALPPASAQSLRTLFLASACLLMKPPTTLLISVHNFLASSKLPNISSQV